VIVSVLAPDARRAYVVLDQGAPHAGAAPCAYLLTDVREEGAQTVFRLASTRSDRYGAPVRRSSGGAATDAGRMTTRAAQRGTEPDADLEFLTNPFDMLPTGEFQVGPTLLACRTSRPPPGLVQPALAFCERSDDGAGTGGGAAAVAIGPVIEDVRWDAKPAHPSMTFYLETATAPPPPAPPPAAPPPFSARTLRRPGSALRAAYMLAPQSATCSWPQARGPPMPTYATLLPYADVAVVPTPFARRLLDGPRGPGRMSVAEDEAAVLAQWRAKGEPPPTSLWMVTGREQAAYATLFFLLGVFIFGAFVFYPLVRRRRALPSAPNRLPPGRR
jgi:hypothetical protein